MTASDWGMAKTLSAVILGTLVVSQSATILNGLCGTVLKVFFKRVDVPTENNHVLVPKIQTFLKNRAIGGNRTVIENGNDTVKTGIMVTLRPFSIVYVKDLDKGGDINMYLSRFGQKTNTFVEYLNQMSRTDNSISFYTVNYDSDNKIKWEKSKTLERARIPLLYHDEMVTSVNDNLTTFLNSQGSYQRLGKTHKYTLLLCGPHGTGKTSLTKHLAMKYGRDVYIIDPRHYFCDMMDLQKTIINSCIMSPCQGAILLFEDVDLYFATLYAEQQKPNISNFLNLLDGLCTPENVIIILTANYEGDIPESIKRDGRIDLSIGFSYVDEELKRKICATYRTDPELIEIEGRVTTSELIKRIDRSREALNNGTKVLVQGDTFSRAHSADSISILS